VRAGVSTRRYPTALEPVGEQVQAMSRSTSRSAVSRRFVAMTQAALADLLAADLSGVDLVALMIDGVHFADHLCVVALGIDIHGTKHPLAVVEGSTENTTLVRSLLVGLRERGLDVTKPILAVLDGAKALAAAVKEVFDAPVIGRCQLHKMRNVADHLPHRMRGPVTKRMRAAYHADTALQAEALLEALAKEMDKTHPGAAGSLREGMAETLIVLRLGLPPTLARTLRSTNAIWVFDWPGRGGVASHVDRPALALNAIGPEGALDSNCRAGRLGAGPGAWLEESLEHSTQICRRPGPAACNRTRVVQGSIRRDRTLRCRDRSA